MSTPNGYRLLDETEDATLSRRKPPWPPLGIFILTILFAPLGALLFGINWARLNQPERRGPVLAAALFAFVVPLVVMASALWYNVDPSRVYWRPVMSLISIAIAYWQLSEQRPAFDSYLARGGQAASTRTLWLCGLLAILFFVGAAFLKSGR